jgi:hypothetical protein
LRCFSSFRPEPFTDVVCHTLSVLVVRVVIPAVG